MSNKHVLFRSEAREKLLRGATTLTDAVRVTLGPKSKCVLVDKKYGRPLVCNDGVTIAKEVELKDPEENLGVRMIREAAERTGDHAVMVGGVRHVAVGVSSAIRAAKTEIVVTGAEIRQARAALNAAQKTLLGTEADRREAQKNLDYTVIRSRSGV